MIGTFERLILAFGLFFLAFVITVFILGNILLVEPDGPAALIDSYADLVGSAAASTAP